MYVGVEPKKVESIHIPYLEQSRLHLYQAIQVLLQSVKNEGFYEVMSILHYFSQCQRHVLKAEIPNQHIPAAKPYAGCCLDLECEMLDFLMIQS
jgi:hypothetical protein